MSGNYKFSALFVLALTVGLAAYTVQSKNRPLLGLDLQGGVSVVLEPTGEVDDEESLEQAVEIIRSRVDALGVAEPEISRQGQAIVVDLPGVDEQQRALALVGQTAELRFRPVFFDLPGFIPPTGDDAEVDVDDEESDSGENGDSEESRAPVAGRFAPAAPVQDTDAESDGSEESGTDADADAGAPASDEAPIDADAIAGDVDPEIQAAVLAACSSITPTAPEDDNPDDYVLLPDRQGNLLCLGPAQLTGDALETARVDIDQFGAWTVNPTFKSGPEGIDAFNDSAAQCVITNPDVNTCPAGRLAIVLDHEVVSSPRIQAAAFSRDRVVISGAFLEEEARDLASVLRFGALPVELEAQRTRTISASVGEDVLRAGIIAGLFGLALVAIYLIGYYKLAGLVAIAGLLISGVLLWGIISWFGSSLGLALTLAGVVGLIVSVGVSADSNIVYFENVKEAYKGGRKVTTSVERAYRSAISTIIKADVVSLIAAGLLFWLTVGAVRGFAFYLGLATIVDLFISWLFMRPALMFLAQRQAVKEKPSLLGLPTGGAA